MTATPNAKVPIKYKNKTHVIRYVGDETDPEKIKAEVLRRFIISVSQPGKPVPVAEIAGEVELANEDGTPFSPEVVRGIKFKETK